MKEIEFWVGSLTYGLSWLHVNTICSRYLRTPVPGDCWGRDATVPKAGQALKGTQLSPSSGSLCFFKENSTLRGLYAIPLPICHSDSAMRWAGTFPSWKLSVQNESCQPCFHPGAGTAVWKAWEVTMEKVPNEAKDFVPRQRKGLGKFQGNSWLKPLHSWPKLSVICTPETCRHTWTKREQSDNIYVLHVRYNPGKTKICFQRASPSHTRLRGSGWGWRRVHRLRKEFFKTYLQPCLNCSAEMFCGPVQTGQDIPFSWITPFSCVSAARI